MTRHAVRALAVAAGLSLVAARAYAGPQQKEDSQGDSADGYGYTFDDDPLSAGGFGPNDAIIRVRPRAAQATLIRPRTSFVPELLRSIENL